MRRFAIALVVFVFSMMFVQAQDENAAMIEALMEATEPLEFQHFPSPDEAWIATVTIYPCTEIDGWEVSYEVLELIDTDTDETVVIAEQFISCGGLGAYGLLIIRWTDNFLYYTDSRTGQPDGLSAGWAPIIYLYDLEAGEVLRLGSGQFSPDQEWLVVWSETVIVLPVDTAAGIEFGMPIETPNIIQVIMLPDSSGMLVVTADDLMSVSQTSVIHIEFETNKETVILTTGE